MLSPGDAALDFLGQGAAFPLAPDGRGRLPLARGEASIEQAIWLILSTAKGERVMLPEFGCGMDDLVFLPNSELARGDVVGTVQDALVHWEPRIDVLGVDAESPTGRPNVLLIRVDYRIRSVNTVHNVVYPFYLTEGR
ncbi:GPW/gp25 family protein [Mycolicibacterium sp. CR10]|uniref:GPW/gp25 family protein n=1 Tax=Mycolicibacterium sp. CR10 TaxID=2562314 RepID=UPI00197B20DE|nr:GPW/gp25 family protein [Mycolicibacterium sp. CR10]